MSEDIPEHYAQSYQVVVVGCNEQARATSKIVVLVVRKFDGDRIRLEVTDCHHESEELGELVEECAVLVIYYCTLEQLKKYMLATFKRLSTLARVIKVCVNSEGNVDRAPYYFPMKDPTNFFAEMDNPESKVLSDVFWQEIALGQDYRNMETSDAKGRQRSIVNFDSSDGTLEASLDLRPNPSRCSTHCELL